MAMKKAKDDTLLNISYNDHITNEEVRRKIQAAIEEYDELLPLAKKRKQTRVVWPRLNVFCFSKDDSTEHSDRKKKKR